MIDDYEKPKEPTTEVGNMVDVHEPTAIAPADRVSAV
jgi:hypothetical protein